MGRELIDVAGCKIHLLRDKGLSLSDCIEQRLRMLELRCHLTYRETITDEHPLAVYKTPTILTNEDGLFENVVWEGFEGEINEDKLVALLYGRSSSFRFLLTSLDGASMGVNGTIWILNGVAKIKPRVFLSATRTSALETGLCVTIDEFPRVLFSSPDLTSSLPALSNFVAMNLEPLLENWNCKIGTFECLKRLRKVEGVSK